MVEINVIELYCAYLCLRIRCALAGIHGFIRKMNVIMQIRGNFTDTCDKRILLTFDYEPRTRGVHTATYDHREENSLLC